MAWHMDDGTLAAPMPKVINSIQRIKADMVKVGLSINPKKCEATFLAYTDDAKHDALQQLHSVLPEIREVPVEEVELLGAPIPM